MATWITEDHPAWITAAGVRGQVMGRLVVQAYELYEWHLREAKPLDAAFGAALKRAFFAAQLIEIDLVHGTGKAIITHCQGEEVFDLGGYDKITPKPWLTALYA